MRQKLIIATLMATICAALLTGCGSRKGRIQIFQDKDAEYNLKPVDNVDLTSDDYYIKNGTKFYKVYAADTKGSYDSDKNKGVAWIYGKNENLVPTYYGNELLAVASKDTSAKDIVLERYKDIGYSVGIYNATYNEEGYIEFNLGQNVVKKSSADKKLKNDRSDKILIEKINGEKVSPDMLNAAGVIVGLEHDKVYDVSFYAGTYYGECKLVADTHFYQSYEMYGINTGTMTKNGYISYKMPEDAKDGYYMVKGEKGGMFRYVTAEKGSVDLETVDYNKPFYETEEDKIKGYSQQYSFELDKNVVNASIVAALDEKTFDNYDLDAVKMLVTAPNGTETIFGANALTNELSADYALLSPGKWTINIIPYELPIKSIDVETNELVQERMTDTYQIDMANEQTNIKFYLDFEGSNDIVAQLVDLDGQVHDLQLEQNKNRMSCVLNYVAPGQYFINAYHYEDSVITNVDLMVNEENENEEVIVIEE